MCASEATVIGLDRALRAVRFPVIDQPRTLGTDASRDCLLLPSCDGSRSDRSAVMAAARLLKAPRRFAGPT